MDGRWFGDARVIFEGAQVDFIYAGINDHQGSGRFPRHSRPFSELFYTVSGEGNMTCGSRTERCRAGHHHSIQPDAGPEAYSARPGSDPGPDSGLAMERAGKVLLQTDHTVAEVAERMDYADSSAFIKAFRRDMGLAPHAYRVLHGSG